MVSILVYLTEHYYVKYFMINWLLSILLIEWAFYKYKPLHIRTEKDKEMAEKYPAFRRNDLHMVNRLTFYLLAPTTFIRFFIGWGSICIQWMAVMVSLIGHDYKLPIPLWRHRLIKAACSMAARTVLFMGGISYVEEPKYDVDYSEYLGPDWKPSWENPGTVVSNHVSFTDVMCHMYR